MAEVRRREQALRRPTARPLVVSAATLAVFLGGLWLPVARGQSGTVRTSSGLGLFVCKEITERHRGRIWLESTQDVGTSFYFTISE